MTAITITNSGRQLIRDGVSGAANDILSYVAVGSSSTAPSNTDTQLGSETFRKAVSSYLNVATNELQISMYMSPSDDLGDNIQEVGFFGGNASGTPNSGTLFARGLYSHTRPSTASEGITFVVDLTVN